MSVRRLPNGVAEENGTKRGGSGECTLRSSYGYRYMKKTDASAAYYEVLESEAEVVRMVFELYALKHLSINAIARLLNQRGIATRTGRPLERSTVWGILRNRHTRARLATERRNYDHASASLGHCDSGMASQTAIANHERLDRVDRSAVPALVGEETFALAQEQLTKNRHHSPRERLSNVVARDVGMNSV